MWGIWNICRHLATDWFLDRQPYFVALFPMDKIAITRNSDPRSELASDSLDSLFEISRQNQAGLSLPSSVSLTAPDISDCQQLDLLFPLQSIDDFVIGQLRPTDLGAGIFSPSKFIESIDMWQVQLQKLALERPADARRFGRLARILRERHALCRLAKMYSSALLQG
jgi:hypothetical protein